MIDKILIFIIFLGPLVFFHELGHFLFARFFKVRVEVFSIGFGPKLWKWKRNDKSTEYAFSLIPLGGYVKMFGDDPFKKNEISVENQQFSFNHKTIWQRFWIVAGGPIFNFILAFVIFFVLNFSGQKIPELKLGKVFHDNILYSHGIRTADILTSTNGHIIENISDLAAEEKIRTLTVKRNNTLIKLNLDMNSHEFLKSFVKIAPILRKPIVIDLKGDTYAISLQKNKIDWKMSLEQLELKTNLSKFYLHKINLKSKKVTSILDINLSHPTTNNNSNFDDSFLKKYLFTHGYFSLDMQIKSIVMGSAADIAKLQAKDIILSLDGKKIYSFEELKKILNSIPLKEIKIEVFRNGMLKTINLTPHETTEKGINRKLLGVYSNVQFIAPILVSTQPKAFMQSISGAMDKTIGSIRMTFDYFIKLITAQISAKSIGGALSIGKVASDSFKTSLSYFFQLMGLISVNLGVINLFPVPVLDGGHILFLIFEFFNKGPLSQRKMEIAQQFGLSVLLLLMGWSLFNDFSRFFFN